MMKKVLLIVTLCLFVALPSLADFHGDGYSGGTGNSKRIGGYYSGDGGEFTLYGRGLTLSNNAYAPSTSGLDNRPESLQTFCLELDEHTYNPVNIRVSTQNAALDDFGSHAYGGGVNTNDGDDLDPVTAYLYTQFAQGTLSNYDYTPGAGRSNSAGLLQQTIWYIEDEYTNYTPAGQVASWISEAEAAIEGKNWTGIGDVRVLQMCKADGVNKQDFLYLMPVPVPAAALLALLGMSVAGIKLRKFA
jgi:hypothetical protein